MIKLEKNSKVFKMANGKFLIINSEDYKELTIAIATEMAINGDNRIDMIGDAPLERAKFMQNVYNESKEEMNDSTKNKYLQEMLNLLKNNDYDLITLEKKKTENKKV